MTAKPIMIQGTMSSVGKSLIAAGLCRVLAQDGVRVAPFKSQNMALNSFITASGDEMGRAQVMQAEAAGVEPEAAMNPILLKPTDDVGSQVIVGGRVLGNMPAREYFAFKPKLKPRILDAYNDLARRFDVIVIEGAGSPVEINLKKDDIVNMGLAEMVGSPVLIVGDIDRGGVFAQLVGTMELLTEAERARVRGLVVNKFRGDVSLLEPGLATLEGLCGVPVLGVVPYTQLDIDDEDSLSDRFAQTRPGGIVDVAVIRLPRISNFTDLIALSAIDGVNVRYVERPAQLGAPDLVVVPGTKSTVSDLLWMRQSGLEAAVRKHAAAGGAVIGICGGYQILGEEVVDAVGAEGGGSVRGMGLLPVRTVFEPAKRQVRSDATVASIGGALAPASGLPVSGYEIHMGKTERKGGHPFCTITEPDGAGRPDGCWRGNVYGTYLHGIFDSAAFAQAVVSALAQRKGADPAGMRAHDMRAYKEEQYDKLARAVRGSLDMDAVYRIIEEGL